MTTTQNRRPQHAEVAAYQSLIGSALTLASQAEKLVAVANGLAAGTTDLDVAIAYAEAGDALAAEQRDAFGQLPTHPAARVPEPLPARPKPGRRRVTTVVRDEAAAR